eukprot:6202590-Pleurochrysis_carterae.AAC.6
MGIPSTHVSDKQVVQLVYPLYILSLVGLVLQALFSKKHTANVRMPHASDQQRNVSKLGERTTRSFVTLSTTFPSLWRYFTTNLVCDGSINTGRGLLITPSRRQKQALLMKFALKDCNSNT